MVLYVAATGKPTETFMTYQIYFADWRIIKLSMFATWSPDATCRACYCFKCGFGLFRVWNPGILRSVVKCSLLISPVTKAWSNFLVILRTVVLSSMYFDWMHLARSDWLQIDSWASYRMTGSGTVFIWTVWGTPLPIILYPAEIWAELLSVSGMS